MWTNCEALFGESLNHDWRQVNIFFQITPIGPRIKFYIAVGLAVASGSFQPKEQGNVVNIWSAFVVALWLARREWDEFL